MRKSLVEELLKIMEVNKDIYFITADLGYFLFDRIRDQFPDRFVNTGASEFSAVGMAVGLAKMGKIPFVYSITPFLMYRAFEMIRNYVDFEKIPIILLGGGRDNDYHIDGQTHDSTDLKPILDNLNNIKQYWPETAEEIPNLVKKVIKDEKPTFISLRK